MSPKDFQAYAVGICNASVCSNLTLEETTRQLNREHPTGIGKWELSQEPTFAAGEPQPCPCNLHPETHKHYLFEC